jgi:hypothetical protein
MPYVIFKIGVEIGKDALPMVLVLILAIAGGSTTVGGICSCYWFGEGRSVSCNTKISLQVLLCPIIEDSHCRRLALPSQGHDMKVFSLQVLL